MCKPLLPVIKDEMAHLFWKAQHIATVHHHHGDHHAEEETATATHEEENDQHPSATKITEPVQVHVVAQNDYNIPQPSLIEQKFGVTICKLSIQYSAPHDRPPQILL